MNVTKADVDKPFKLNGLFLAPDASAYLLQIAQRVDASKRQKVLRRIVETVLKQKIDETRITKTLCEQAVNECKADRSVDNPVLYVIDAFEVPRFHYSKSLKKFIPLENTNMNRQMDSIFPASAQVKAFLYAHRYEVVQQRVLRHQLFSQTSAKGNASTDGSQLASYRIRPIEYLLASGSRIDSVIVLGMLCQLREGDWHLEDPTGIVRLNLSQAVFHEGLFPEGCIVLAEGSYDDNLLLVTGMGLPPCESGDASRRAFSVSNPFGGGPPGTLAASQDPKMHRLLTTTQAGADAMLVLLGETRLDRAGCLDKLATVFTGYSACPPVAFILTGNFLSPDSSGRSCPERLFSLRVLLRQLLIQYRTAFPDIDSLSPAQCPHLILVPGPEDPVCAPFHLLPKPGLPFELVMTDLERRRGGDEQSSVTCPPWLHLASNPCRLRLYTREIVIFRAEYSRLLLRHCIHLPTTSDTSPDSTAVEQDGETQLDRSVPATREASGLSTTANIAKLKTPAEQLGVGLARCLASQGHLLPLMGHIAPVYWAWDQALSLHPLPDLVVAVEPQALIDLNVTTANPVQTGNCRFINPGQFGQTVASMGDSGSRLRTEYAFKVYYPQSAVVENSCLPD
ncbi:DNA polymerase epsilon subunit 2 [Paragonimus westermani]|uniref:DNA polymerase II subunit 2 n=1 Tax=Paragonimus westermani TaxID=34504 RepID=A0A5J4NR01_9TREM|nr:DNA polymerase epsilon subunit 2 [Paragonimus westermani]